MMKLTAFLFGIALASTFSFPIGVSAQVQNQNQVTTGPYGGIPISTSTTPSAKLNQIRGSVFGDLLYWTGSRWNIIATSSLGITATSYTGTYPVQVISSAISLAFGTTTPNVWSGLQTFTNGFISQASSTIAVLHLGTPLEVASGGTGSTTLTGLLKGNGTSAVQTAVPGTDYIVPATPFTNGSVPYANSSGQLTQDNADFFWDAANLRLGIGTNNPSQSISVAAPNRANWVQLDRTSTAYESAFQWTTGGSPSFFLGLRNVSPNTGLHMYDYSISRDVMILNAGGDLEWNQGGTFIIDYLAGTGTRMVTATAGGALGTAAIPTGTVTGVTGTYPVISSGGTAPAISLAFGTTTQNFWNAYNNFSSLFATLASTTNATTTVSQYFPFLATPAGTILAVDPTGKLIATTTSAGGGNSKWATSTDLTSIYPNSATKVGIGTSTPQKILTVVGNQSGGIARIQRQPGIADYNSVYGTYDIQLDESTTSQGFALGTGPAQTFSIATNTGPGGIMADISAIRGNSDFNGSLLFRTYYAAIPAIAEFIDSQQRIGIGTTSLSAQLNVATGTVSQIFLSDGTATQPAWYQRSISGNFYMGTDTPSTFATTTNPWLSVLSTGTTFLGKVTIGNLVLTNPLPIASGGTGAISATTNQLWYSNGTTVSTVATTTLGGGTTGLTFSNNPVIIGGSASALAGTLVVANGGTGLTSFPANQVLYGGGAGTTIAGIATSSETCTTPLSCGAHIVLTGGGAITLGTVLLANGGTGTTTMYNGGATFWNTTLSSLSQTASTSGFFVKPEGLIGLGTTSPHAQLEIASSTGPQLILHDLTSSNTGWYQRVISGTFYIGTTSPTGATSTVASIALTSSNTTAVGVATSTWRTFGVTGTVALDGLTTGATGGVLCLTTVKEVTFGSLGTCTPSSRRYKEDIEPITDDMALSIIERLTPVTFHYKPGVSADEDMHHQERIGLIAEDVYLVEPRLAGLNASGTPETLEYDQFPGFFVKALQEVVQKLNGQDDRLDALEERVTALERENGGLKAGMCYEH